MDRIREIVYQLMPCLQDLGMADVLQAAAAILRQRASDARTDDHELHRAAMFDQAADRTDDAARMAALAEATDE